MDGCASVLFFHAIILPGVNVACVEFTVGVPLGEKDKDEAELMLLTAATAIANDNGNNAGTGAQGNTASAANLLSGPADDAKVPSRVAVKKLSNQVRKVPCLALGSSTCMLRHTSYTCWCV